MRNVRQVFVAIFVAVCLPGIAKASNFQGFAVVRTRIEMKQLDTKEISHALLLEPGREGFFRLEPDSANMVSDDQEGITIKSSSEGYHWERVFDGAANASWFGTREARTQEEMLRVVSAMWKVCLATGHNLYFPSGRYEIGDANFPWRQESAGGLLDCGNIIIFGDGAGTITNEVGILTASIIAKNSRIVLIGNKGDCHYKAQIGAARGTPTENCYFYIDLGGKASLSIINAVDFFGILPVKYCTFCITRTTASFIDIPASFKPLLNYSNTFCGSINIK